MKEFNELNPDVLFNAINTYCRHMNYVGGEAEVDAFLSSKHGKRIKFDEEGNIILHKVSK